MRTSFLRVAAAAATTAVAALGASTAGAATLPTLQVGLTGKAVTAVQGTASGSYTLSTTVSGEKTGSVAFVKLNQGVPFAAFAQAAAAVNKHHGDLNYIDPYGSLVYDQPVNKGSNLGSISLTPGNYFILDIGQTHSGTPPYWPLVVAQSPYAFAPLPTPGATVSTIEFGFTGPSTLHNGEVVRFANAGFLVHMVIGIKAPSMRAAKLIVSLLKAGKDNKAQGLATGFADFVDGFSPGGMSQYAISAKPGVYVLACFMDTQDGREHTRLGMEKIIHITK